MLEKEQGYDEYLKQQVKEGLKDAEEGRLHSIDESRQLCEKVIFEIKNGAK